MADEAGPRHALLDGSDWMTPPVARGNDRPARVGERPPVSLQVAERAQCRLFGATLGAAGEAAHQLVAVLSTLGTSNRCLQ